MNLELLRTFLEVAHARHFGRAAEALHLTQAAVSARIKQLETLLGVTLFDRYRRDIRLTPEGTRLIRHADLLLAEWRKARQEISAGGRNLQLSLGGSPRLWDVLVQDWLHRLRRTYPGLAIAAELHPPEMLTRRLLDGVLDVAFMLEPPQLEVLRIEEIAMVELVMVSTRAALTADQALASDYVMVDWGLSHALQHRRSFPDAPEALLRVAQAKMALAYLLELGGSAYLPLRMAGSALRAGRLHRVADAPTLEYRAYAVFPVRAAKETLIRDTLALFG